MAKIQRLWSRVIETLNDWFPEDRDINVGRDGRKGEVGLEIPYMGE